MCGTLHTHGFLQDIYYYLNSLLIDRITEAQGNEKNIPRATQVRKCLKQNLNSSNPTPEPRLSTSRSHRFFGGGISEYTLSVILWILGRLRFFLNWSSSHLFADT